MNLEKKLKKVKGIQTLLIIVVALLLIYTILLWGDVQSAKGIAKNAHANEMAEIDTKINDMNADIAKCEENIAKYEAEIAEYQADIDAIKDGTYVAE